MCARFTVLNETPIAGAIAGWVTPLSRSNTIWMRSRCDAGSFHRSAVFSFRTWLLVHLTICSPESDDHRIIPSRLTGSSGLPQISDSISYGSGITPYIDIADADNFLPAPPAFHCTDHFVPCEAYH